MTERHDCTIRELIDGAEGVPAEELPFVLTDPDSGESLHPQRASAPDSVERAIAAASAAHRDGVWTGLARKERAAALRTLQSELMSRAGELGRADGLDSGAPQGLSTVLVSAVTGQLEHAASQVEEGFGHIEYASSVGTADQLRLPWGPAAVFLPWNAPATTAIMKTASALVAGCPVLIKPSEWGPHFSGVFAEAVRAALPDGVVQILHGGRSVGGAVVADARVAAVSYTGGVTGGRAVAQTCARDFTPVDLELSGNNPVIALPDAEPESVVEHLVPGMLLLNGQWCLGPRRLIVPESRAEEYLAALGAALDAVAIGASTDPKTQLGPLAHDQHRRRIEAQIAEFAALGCEVRRYGRLPDLGGHFAAPAVVLADNAASLKEEVFGPVLLVRTYRDIEEAVTVANDHPYGLSGYVFGADREAARRIGRRLRAGLVTLNAVLGGPTDVPRVGSMWGVSGLGNVGLGEGAKFFSGHRAVG